MDDSIKPIRRIRKTELTSRAAAAQAELKAELSRRLAERRDVRRDCIPMPARIPLTPSKLPLAERYRLFVDTIKATAAELAPLASVVVDRIRDSAALVEITQAGTRAEAAIAGALESPETSGADVASLLCRRLQEKLGARALRGPV